MSFESSSAGIVSVESSVSSRKAVSSCSMFSSDTSPPVSLSAGLEIEMKNKKDRKTRNVFFIFPLLLKSLILKSFPAQMSRKKLSF
ncbi:MAG: hypothetical protein A2889_10015 [Nitrospinae bacterium RIFCSPLOWO2_01_FULL_39_10]|nr:MAG: hypothetical protein A2889_10015 [Nitrospinae bacterium RIFCSPLOWO2_01_FULL_39_10]